LGWIVQLDLPSFAWHTHFIIFVLNANELSKNTLK